MINGLPAHVLLVHIVVVFVPLAALLLILSAVWPSARRRLGVITPIVALIALAAIPPTTNAGSWLLKRVDRSSQVTEHAQLADGLLPWVIGLFAVALLLWVVFEKSHWLRRDKADIADKVTAEPALVGGHTGHEDAGTHAAPEPAPSVALALPTWLRGARLVLVVLAVVVSVGSVVDVAIIGDAGAQAAWHDGFSMNPLPPGGSGH